MLSVYMEECCDVVNWSYFEKNVNLEPHRFFEVVNVVDDYDVDYFVMTLVEYDL